jgi:hypothetical protein
VGERLRHLLSSLQCFLLRPSESSWQEATGGASGRLYSVKLLLVARQNLPRGPMVGMSDCLAACMSTAGPIASSHRRKQHSSLCSPTESADTDIKMIFYCFVMR